MRNIDVETLLELLVRATEALVRQISARTLIDDRGVALLVEHQMTLLAFVPRKTTAGNHALSKSAVAGISHDNLMCRRRHSTALRVLPSHKAAICALTFVFLFHSEFHPSISAVHNVLPIARPRDMVLFGAITYPCLPSPQMNSLQCPQKVGCLKNRAENLWLLTMWTFRRFMAPLRRGAAGRSTKTASKDAAVSETR